MNGDRRLYAILRSRISEKSPKNRQSDIEMKKRQNQIKIFCSHKKLISTDQLKPNPANPNIHSDQQIEKLAKIIQAHGWRHPITISNRSGLIVSGHCRFYAAQRLGIKQVPVDYQDFSSDAEEKAVLIADNKIQELAEIDSQKMDDILAELKAVDYPLELTAIDAEDLEPADATEYFEERLVPYQKTHVLLSFEPELFLKIQPYIERILELGEVEIEQSSN